MHYNLAVLISLPTLQRQSGELIQVEVCTRDKTLGEMNPSSSSKWQNPNIQT